MHTFSDSDGRYPRIGVQVVSVVLKDGFDINCIICDTISQVIVQIELEVGLFLLHSIIPSAKRRYNQSVVIGRVDFLVPNRHFITTRVIVLRFVIKDIVAKKE